MFLIQLKSKHFLQAKVLSLKKKILNTKSVFLYTPSKSCMIRANTTCTVHALCRTVQSEQPSVESTQHVSCNKCNPARSQCHQP